ncbi:transcriptional regulator [Lachnospiraceae bacterium oral taxon 500]|nr:transcriptional regulator [Lachnospiraceae bacterium oral taxon 500]
MKNNKTTFYGKKVKQRLIELDMTQRELAQKVKMNENYITQILTGRKGGYKYRQRINEILWPAEELESVI